VVEQISIKHHTQPLIKFLLLIALLASYFVYLSYEYDILTGGVASILTWSFFVLCTPVADAGFILDFPVRLLFGIRMAVSEMIVWGLAITINVPTLLFVPHYYQTTLITRIFYKILTTPYPYWAVVVLSCIGTFLSIRFGDEIMDIVHTRDRGFFHAHHLKYEIILVLFFLIVIGGYYELIASLNIDVLSGK
jgi:hypothetical protein